MSHNILTLNNNSFDVNSNRTETVSTLKYGYVQEPLSVTVSNYPVYPAAGQNGLINKASVGGNFLTSEVEFNDHPTYTNFIESVTLKANGTYLVQSYFNFFQYSTTGYQKFALYDGSNYISNSSWQQDNVQAYCAGFNMYSTVVITGGVSKTISIRIIQVHPTDIVITRRMLNHLYVEKLQ